MKFYELNCQSNFSFLQGASHPEELVVEAVAKQYSGLAITDECTFSGIVRAHVAAKEHGLKLLIGSLIKVDFKTQKDLTIIFYCPNRLAYSELSTLITKARRREEKGNYRVTAKDLSRYLKNVLAVWLPPKSEELAIEQLTFLKSIFNQRLWLGYNRLRQSGDFAFYQQCLELSQYYHIPMVAQNAVIMHSSERLPLQHCLTAIRLNCTIDNLGYEATINNEQHIRSLTDLKTLYPQALLDETQVIADLCEFTLDELRYDYPNELVPENLTAIDYLTELCIDGCKTRWPKGASNKTMALLDKELKLVAELNYEHYFLTVFDIVAFARNQDILCQGRGSSANSVICYVLFITEVDPEQSELLFERFISKERDEPPDIDVDFEHQRREEVIQYIYQKYTRERAALAATVITYRMKSAIRDVGKALGIDESSINHLSQSMAWWDKPDSLSDYFTNLEFSRRASVVHTYYQLVIEILGFPRHLSQHVGGFVITNNPIATLVPVENAAMNDRTVIQWDKYDIEALGLLKIDVLALGMLTMIRKCLELTSSYSSVSSLPDIVKEDAAVYNMLSNGDSVGVFQIESRAQMSMLPRLKPQSFYDLVIQIAIVRPGPIQGDMVHPYLRRREGSEQVDYPSDDIEQVLKRTLGVPIFQEQVIQLAMVAAGFSGGQADQLRRAMASWGRNGDLYKFREKLLKGMLARGYSKDFAQRLFEQMKGFGSYGFPESHSASFAILAYFSAWLKRHHAAAFYCALLNSQPMGFYSSSQLIQDARRHGIKVQPIDVDFSQWSSTLEDLPESFDNRSADNQQPTIRLGLHLVKGFNSGAAERLVIARNKRPFNHLKDLVERARLNQKEREALVRANTLIRIAKHRFQAQWQVLAVEQERPLLTDVERAESYDLDDQIELDSPTDVEDMVMDYRSTGLTLNKHPMAMLRNNYPISRCWQANQLNNLKQGQFVRIAGVVTCRQRPGTAAGVLFLTVEDETGNFNVIVWKTTLERFRKEILNSKLLLIKGTIERERKVIHVIAGHIEDISDRLPR
ncbi:MAG: error-prone DNA polymerase, partial [Kangiellaceae bacterium]|nr:error-prone DNA polymerase [Kangiellaceae bacterium]